MHLVVHVSDRAGNRAMTRYELEKFGDQDKVAAHIGRLIRNWIRVVPVRASGSRLDLLVTAEWVEGKDSRLPIQPEAAPTLPSPKRKKKARK